MITRFANPRRPPKKWWYDCVAGVRAGGSAMDPQRVCGSLWYHKMSEAQRQAVLRRESERSANLVVRTVRVR
jgi:hypothetical protein